MVVINKMRVIVMVGILSFVFGAGFICSLYVMNKQSVFAMDSDGMMARQRANEDSPMSGRVNANLPASYSEWADNGQNSGGPVYQDVPQKSELLHTDAPRTAANVAPIGSPGYFQQGNGLPPIPPQQIYVPFVPDYGSMPLEVPQRSMPVSCEAVPAIVTPLIESSPVRFSMQKDLTGEVTKNQGSRGIRF